MRKFLFCCLLISTLLGCRPSERATPYPSTATPLLLPTDTVDTVAPTPSAEPMATPIPLPTASLPPTLSPTLAPLFIPTASPNLASHSPTLFADWVYGERLGGWPTHLAVVEPYLYTIVGRDTLVIANRDGNSFFAPVSQLYLGQGRVEELGVENGIAYVIRVTASIDVSNRALILIDVGDAAAPHILSSWSEPFNKATIDNNLAYLGEGDVPYYDPGLRILDLSNPNQVKALGWLPLPTPVGAVAIAPPYAYISDGSTLYIADISQAASPSLVGSVALTPLPDGTPWPYLDTQVALLENRILARTGQELYLLDRHNPTQPQIVAHYDQVHLMTAGNQQAFFSTPTGFYGSDVLYSLTAEQTELGEPVLASVGPLNDLATTGDSFYTLDNYTVYQINPDPDNPAQTGVNEVYFPPSFSAEAITLIDEHLYIATESRIVGWDVSHPLQPNRSDSSFLGSTTHIRAIGDYLIDLEQDDLAQQTVLTIHDSRKDETSSWISSLTLPNVTHVQSIHQIGSQLYLAVPTQGVLIVDLTDLYQPYHLASIPLPDISGMVGGNNTLYTANGSQIQVWDVDDPALPVPISSLAMVDANTDRTYGISDMVLDGQWLYVALGGFEMAVVDASSAEQLTLQEIVPLDMTYGLTITGNYLFGFTPNPVTYELDLVISSLPLTGTEKRFMSIPAILPESPGQLTSRIVLVGDVVFVAAGANGVQMIQLLP